ncbi:hypothetical protein BDW59DRAFT_138078 [Aspergillus cavernicola]|uniref:NAD(P)-binding protein n=1 Tax=Aspergillus cavernicola TaxID=176166 RepID=A0ABR4J0Y3_9EURO
MPLIWLITGTSSGFGNEFVKQVLSRGDKVIATARNVAKISHLKELGAAVMALDVTSPQPELNAKAAEAISVYGQVDVLVNNAAFTQFGFLEDMNDENYVKQFNTNVFGTINTTRAFLPHLRSRKAGTIVTIGSMSAWETYPGVGAYSASKAALRYAMDALDQEVGSIGIKSLLVEPGQFRTELLSSQNSNYAETNIQEYQAVAQATFETFRGAHGNQRGDVQKGVARIIDVVRGENGAAGKKWPKELVLGPDAVAVIRKKCEETLKMLAEWEQFSTGTDVV